MIVEWPLATPIIGLSKSLVLVAHRVVHRAVGRAGDALGDVLRAFVVGHGGCRKRKRAGERAIIGQAFRLSGRPSSHSPPEPRVPASITSIPSPCQLGPISIHWYGLMYLIGFALFLLLGRLRSRDAWRDMVGAGRRRSAVLRDDRRHRRRSARPRASSTGRCRTTSRIRSRSSRCGRAAWHRTAAFSA